MEGPFVRLRASGLGTGPFDMVRANGEHVTGGVRLGVEATGGFEPPNRGFADPRLRPLGYVASECVVPRMRLELIQP